MYIEKLASAIKNNLVSGLRGFHTNMSLSDELLEDSVIAERLLIIKEYASKGLLPKKDLYISINCIPIDCKDLERCNCRNIEDCSEPPIAHFEIPQILNELGAIDYIGSTDRQLPFIYYTSPQAFRNRKYRKRGKNRPSVWIDTTPNKDGYCDCYVFNAPLLKNISVSAIFKDPRQLSKFECCIEDNTLTYLDNEIIKRLTEKYLRWYRQAAVPLKQNDQTYSEG